MKTLGLAAFLLAGCAGTLLAATAEAASPAPEATAEGDAPADEAEAAAVSEGIEEEEAEEEEAEEGEAGDEYVGVRPLGARAGAFVPAFSDDEGYASSFTLGAFYAGELRGLGGLAGLETIPFEAGLDLARTESDDGRVEAGFYTARFDLLFPTRASAPRPELYLVGGFQIVVASLDVDGARADSEYASGVNVGAGVAAPDGSWDARLACSFLAGSGNLKGLIHVTGGYRF